jgi:hypothetical protein
MSNIIADKFAIFSDNQTMMRIFSSVAEKMLTFNEEKENLIVEKGK